MAVEVAREHKTEAPGRRRSARSAPRLEWRRYVAALVVGDAVAVTLAGVLAQAFRFGDLWTAAKVPENGVSYAIVLAVMVPVWVLAMALRGGYDPINLGTGSEEYRRVFDGAVRYLAVVAAGAFAFKYDVARGFVAIAIPLATLLTLSWRYAVRRWLHRQRNKGRFVRSVLVAGTEASVRDVADRLSRSRYTGVAVEAACVPTGAGELVVNGKVIPVVGRLDQIVTCAVASRSDAIVVADATASANGSLRRLAWQLEGTGIGLMVAPDIADLTGPRITIRPVADLPLLQLEEPEFTGWRRLAKSAFDRIVAATMLIALAPVLLLIALAIRLTGGKPAFFRQVRVGMRGQPFVMWKFRTMVVDAEARLEAMWDQNEQDEVLFKIRDDPRVTRVGRRLRRWSLDELPQLWNVVRGEMSLVGPRPPLPSEVEHYSDLARRRLLVKPGMTGLWQVSGRSGLSWEESVRLDLHYVENWSPSLDAIIMARTMMAVLWGRGAC
jgi:exopolysaccharide biosynthesis polyprenyl glycosylphosphotransferase